MTPAGTLSFALFIVFACASSDNSIHARAIISAVQQITGVTQWPTSGQIVGQLKVGDYSNPIFSLLVPDVRLRVDPIGDASGFKNVAQFLSIPTSKNARVTSTEYQMLSVDASERTAMVRTKKRYELNNGTAVFFSYDQMQLSTWKFDQDDRLVSLLIVTANTQANIDPISSAVGYVDRACTLITSSCTGANQQYASLNDCKAFLNSRPFGDFNNLRKNSVYCRGFFADFAEQDPAGWCSAVGPSGGNRCVDAPAADLWPYDM